MRKKGSDRSNHLFIGEEGTPSKRGQSVDVASFKFDDSPLFEESNILNVANVRARAQSREKPDIEESKERPKLKRNISKDYSRGSDDSDDFESAGNEASERAILQGTGRSERYYSAKVTLDGDEEVQEPLERDVLPWLKDPKTRPSVWTILKDSVGKDLSRIGVPVYFNDPTSLLQKCAQGFEYAHLLDDACRETDPIMRMAILAVQ